VTANFVSRRGDLANQFWMPLSDPAEQKEGGLDVVPGKQIEDVTRLGLYQRRKGSPPFGADAAFQFGRMEVFLDVNADNVLRHGSGNLKMGTTRAGKTPVPAGGISGSA